MLILGEKESNMERQPELAVHIGFHKTGSTTFQKNLIPNHPELFDIGVPKWNDRARRFRDLLVSIELTNEDHNELNEVWAEINSERKGRTAVLSDEVICPLMISNISPTVLARRIESLTPNSILIVGIRNPIKLMESWYVHKIKSDRFISFNDWIASPSEKHSQIEQYYFNRIIRQFSEVIGKHRIVVLPLEELSIDVEKYSNRLSSTLRIDHKITLDLLRQPAKNVKKSNRVIMYSRLRNKIFPNVRLGNFLPQFLLHYFETFLKRGRRSKYSVPDEFTRIFAVMYKDDLTELAHTMNIPLDKYGYNIESQQIDKETKT